MKNVLSDGLRRCLAAVRGRGRLSKQMLDDALAELRTSLLQADVAVAVVDSFLSEVRLGAEDIADAVVPERELLKLIRGKLLALLGAGGELSLRARPPAVVMLVGLQGVGKTTTAGKLAVLLRNRRKRVMLASCDPRRPAAVQQLQVLAERAEVEFHQGDAEAGAEAMATAAIASARKKLIDVLIVDSAGRGQTDEGLMQELSRVHQLCQPVETLFVVDSAMGQEGINVARGFAEAVSLSGVVLTKADGDSRGGVALSVRHALAAPIKFLGIGEGLEALEAFVPERFVDRVLGQGDLASLAQAAAAKPAFAIKRKPSRQGLGFMELAEQLRQMQQVGGLAAIAEKLPANLAIPAGSDKRIQHMLAAIDSMTVLERNNPSMLDGSRRKRIAAGSGTSVQLVNQLAKMQKGGSKMYKRLRGASPQNVSRFLKSFSGF
ncbi:MAG: signal recognition particle receptor subunit alpha [Candidatus Porifericomitaceae bacterium WSBS_2022_MAG_OTU9]